MSVSAGGPPPPPPLSTDPPLGPRTPAAPQDSGSAPSPLELEGETWKLRRSAVHQHCPPARSRRQRLPPRTAGAAAPRVPAEPPGAEGPARLGPAPRPRALPWLQPGPGQLLLDSVRGTRGRSCEPTSPDRWPPPAAQSADRPGAGPVARAGPAGPGAGPALRDLRRLPGCPGRAAGRGRRVRWALQPETPGSEGCAEELSTALHWSPGSSLLSPYEWPLQAAHHSGDLSKSPEMFLEGEGFCPTSWEINH